MQEPIQDQHPPLDIPGRPWTARHLPRRILAIRLQAMGDTVITLPYLQKLRNSLPPGTRLDFLTRKEVDPIPRSIKLFDRIYSIGGGWNTKLQLLSLTTLLPLLLLRRYQVVIDLQNNIISQIARRALLPKAWSQFDRFSPIPAGESTRLTIEAIGLGPNPIDTLPQPIFHLKDPEPAIAILQAAGRDPGKELIVLNPAGAFPTRHWPLANYIQFAKAWLQKRPHTQFLVLGTSFIAGKAQKLKQALSTNLLDLTGRTSAAEAFAILQQSTLVLSEDSGLMHMAWVSGIPTLALFGSTRSDRARPLGPKSLLLHSSDLPCGNCMLENCPVGETPCLKRYSPELVLEHALSLLSTSLPDQMDQRKSRPVKGFRAGEIEPGSSRPA